MKDIPVHSVTSFASSFASVKPCRLIIERVFVLMMCKQNFFLSLPVDQRSFDRLASYLLVSHTMTSVILSTSEMHRKFM